MKKVLNFITDNYIIFCVYALIGWIYEVAWYLIVRNVFVNRGVLFGPFLPIYGFGVLILLLLLKKFMSKEHKTTNVLYLTISIFTMITFVLTTIIEYTTSKITRVDYFFEHYGIILLIVNLIGILLGNLYMKKTNNKKAKEIDITIILVFLIIWIITTVFEYIAHYYMDVYSNKILWDYSKDFLNINSRVNWDASRNFAIGGTILLYTIQPLLDKFLNKTKLNKKIVIACVIGFFMLIDVIINLI